MSRWLQVVKLWDISILTALKRNNFSLPFVVGSFFVIGVITFFAPREFQEFMFFFFGVPVIYSGLVFSLPVAFYVASLSFLVHVAASWNAFGDHFVKGEIETLLIEGIIIVVTYLLSCLFITKILINERENQKKLEKMADLNGQVAKELKRANREISQSYTNTIQALAAAIDAKDPYTKGHSERVTNYAVAVAKAMKLPDREVQNIFFGAILHDIGKIGISESILKKPGPLTSMEFKEIKRHPEIGATILSSVPFLQEVIPVVLFHHEYFDGQGYPKGLKGEEIPLGARIIAVVDAFDAITTDRPYREGYSKRRAMSDIRKGAGLQFDSKIVEIFAEILEEDTESFNLAEIAASGQHQAG